MLVEQFVPAAIQSAQAARIPAAIHLDHGFHFETVVKAIRWGFNSVWKLWTGMKNPKGQGPADTTEHLLGWKLGKNLRYSPIHLFCNLVRVIARTDATGSRTPPHKCFCFGLSYINDNDALIIL